jgi:hypothetical protein
MIAKECVVCDFKYVYLYITRIKVGIGMHRAWSHFAVYSMFQEECAILRGERTVHIITISSLVSRYKCRHMPKTSELIDGRYGEKYKRARSIFCVGITPVTLTSFWCLYIGCLLVNLNPIAWAADCRPV